MNKVVELFGHAVCNASVNWPALVSAQQCRYLNKRCYKVRKSDPSISIGSCTVTHGSPPAPIIICPARLIDRGQIFIDCMHLLTLHQPGNELHVVPEVSIPGGSVDYFLVSVAQGRVKDFVGIELQTVDTTGTVWPERQRLIRELGLSPLDEAELSDKGYGMNWKMTAKTILVQMHHKVQTFEHLNKKLVLVVQDCLFAYMSREFRFDHLKMPPVIGDSMHFHAYHMSAPHGGDLRLSMVARLSTDADGIRACLGLQAEPRVELDRIVATLQAKISPVTLFSPAWHY